jgi:hypothetical protein
VMALALGVGGLGACGGDDSKDAASTTTQGLTLKEGVDEFCKRTDEINEILFGLRPDPEETTTTEPGTTVTPQGPTTSQGSTTSVIEVPPEQEQRMSQLFLEASQMRTGLAGATADMLPGDAARFHECAAALGGGVDIPTG